MLAYPIRSRSHRRRRIKLAQTLPREVRYGHRSRSFHFDGQATLGLALGDGARCLTVGGSGRLRFAKAIRETALLNSCHESLDATLIGYDFAA